MLWGPWLCSRFLSSSFRFNVRLIVLSVLGKTCQGVDRKIKFVQQARDRFESNTYYSGKHGLKQVHYHFSMSKVILSVLPVTSWDMVCVARSMPLQSWPAGQYFKVPFR
jgi:hypothetical protein